MLAPAPCPTQIAVAALRLAAGAAYPARGARANRAPRQLMERGLDAAGRRAEDRAHAAGREHRLPIRHAAAVPLNETVFARATSRAGAPAIRHLLRAANGRACRAECRRRPRPQGTARQSGRDPFCARPDRGVPHTPRSRTHVRRC